MPEHKILKFEKLFKATNFGLWLSGSHPTLPRGWALRSIGTVSVCFICFVLLCNSMIYHRIPNKDYEDMVRESIITILSFTIICKYMIMVRNRRIILNMIRYIDDDLSSEEFSVVEQNIFLKYINKGKLVAKFWLMVVVSSGCAFTFQSVGLTLYYHYKGTPRYVLIFELIYPNFLEKYKGELLGYFIMTGLAFAFTIYVMMVYVGFEPLLPIFLLHFCGKLDILSARVENIFRTQSSEEVLHKIKYVNRELQVIYKLVDDLQMTFIALFEFTMKTTTFMMPFTVYQIVQALGRNVLNVEFVCLLSGILLQFYLPCFYSNFLMQKSESMRQAIYSCGWEKYPNPRISKVILFMLTRTSKPVVLHTIFYPLNLETFAEMCRQAYAIYSIMNAV